MQVLICVILLDRARAYSADGGSFVLIVAELLTNAVKHASAPGHLGKVHVRGRVGDGSMVLVSVSDDGPGLAPDFDLAAQTGLGFRMRLTLASQVGGSLHAIPSEPGATVELRVPAATRECSRTAADLGGPLRLESRL